MRQPMSVAAVDGPEIVEPIDGPHVVFPAATPWVLVSATDRHSRRPNALHGLSIVVTGEWVPDFGSTCSSPGTAPPTAFRLTMGGASEDVPNQWRGAVPNLGACRTAFSVGPKGQQHPLGPVHE
jgi:hypothetical protein